MFRHALLVILLFSSPALVALPAAAQEIKPNLRHPCQDHWMLSRAEILACLERDYKAADAELNRVYQATLAELPPGQREKLRVSERDWLRRYDAVLTSYYSTPWGNHSRVNVLPSQIQAVRDRTAWLKRYRPEGTGG